MIISAHELQIGFFILGYGEITAIETFNNSVKVTFESCIHRVYRLNSSVAVEEESE